VPGILADLTSICARMPAPSLRLLYPTPSGAGRGEKRQPYPDPEVWHPRACTASVISGSGRSRQVQTSTALSSTGESVEPSSGIIAPLVEPATGETIGAARQCRPD